ncbi:MAG: hypothetical protein HGA19_24285 [Oscillochloris sp.]|nr:hypothetical protein [Oscillochloris sp.]
MIDAVVEVIAPLVVSLGLAEETKATQLPDDKKVEAKASETANAETRVAILSPAQYLRTSIVAPNSYVVEGFVPGTMTQTFEAALTPAQIEDLVAYLLTLK